MEGNKFRLVHNIITHTTNLFVKVPFLPHESSLNIIHSPLTGETHLKNNYIFL